MRIAPWTRYQFVEQEGYLQHQLATKDTGRPWGCAPFMCFLRASPRVDGSLPPKVGPVNHFETLSDSSPSSSAACNRGAACNANHTVDKTDHKLCIKSSLKKPSAVCSTIEIEGDRDHVHDSLEGEENSAASCTEKRKVQWTDSCGRELVQIKEFEPSDDDTSDDEFDRDSNQKCQCVIQ